MTATLSREEKDKIAHQKWMVHLRRQHTAAIEFRSTLANALGRISPRQGPKAPADPKAKRSRRNQRMARRIRRMHDH